MKKGLLILILLVTVLIIGYVLINRNYNNPEPTDKVNVTDGEVLSEEVVIDKVSKSGSEDIVASQEVNTSEIIETNPEIALEAGNSIAEVDSSYQVFNPVDNRIIAFYGNFYSSRMGILGQYSEPEVLAKLQQVMSEWQIADPARQTIPAIHYIASTAQSTPTNNGFYTMRMPADQILRAIAMSLKVSGLTILDLQVGQADVLGEVKFIERYLRLPNVHIGLDPEFIMSNGAVPGQRIGTIDAVEINQVVDYLSQIVTANSLPPKILVLHRFTENMITNVSQIKQTPQVTTIIEMDGWGSPALKKSTYQHVITNDAVSYSGFKIFYGNDLRPPSLRLITPAEILSLSPVPIYIQYQ